MINSSVETHLREFLEGAALTIHRVAWLKALLETAKQNYNNGHMTHEQNIAYIARIQSILRDIREEMKDYDEAVARVALRQSSWDLYKGATPEMLDLQRIEQEEARRAKEQRLRMGKG